MKDGLEEFLKRIELKPSNETLIDRFITLVLEETGVDRILYSKKLVGLLLNANPYAALKAAYLELQEARKENLNREYEIGALKDVESCFLKLDRKENATLVRDEINKLSSEVTKSPSSSEPDSRRTVSPSSDNDEVEVDPRELRRASLHYRLPRAEEKAKAKDAEMPPLESLQQSFHSLHDGDQVSGDELDIESYEAELSYRPDKRPSVEETQPKQSLRREDTFTKLSSKRDESREMATGREEIFAKIPGSKREDPFLVQPSFRQEDIVVRQKAVPPLPNQDPKTSVSSMEGFRIGPNLLSAKENPSPAAVKSPAQPAPAVVSVSDNQSAIPVLHQSARRADFGEEHTRLLSENELNAVREQEAGIRAEQEEEANQQLHFPEQTNHQSIAKQELLHTVYEGKSVNSEKKIPRLELRPPERTEARPPQSDVAPPKPDDQVFAFMQENFSVEAQSVLDLYPPREPMLREGLENSATVPWELLQDRLRQHTGLQAGRMAFHNYLDRLAGDDMNREEKQKMASLLAAVAEGRYGQQTRERFLVWLFEEVDVRILHQFWQSLKMQPESLLFFEYHVNQLMLAQHYRRALNIIHSIMTPQLELGWYRCSYEYLQRLWMALHLKGWSWSEDEGPKAFCDRCARREDLYPASLLA